MSAISFGLKASSPLLLLVPGGIWAYNKRNQNINHPIMRRGLLELQNDQRIKDFCGDNLRPGYWITVNSDPIENYMKFNFTIKGNSGDLGTTIIADFLTHRELKILEEERKDYFEQKTKLREEMKTKKGAKFDELQAKRKEMDSSYVPIDFDSYSIEDQQLVLNKKEALKEEDKIWRISSLTAYVDFDTKILLLP